MRTQDAKQIPLSHLLAALGHEPVKIVRGERWYRSPLRNEVEASFQVSADQRAWMDHGLGRGGNILDFACLYFGVHGVSEALREIGRYVGAPAAGQSLLFPDLYKGKPPVPVAPAPVKADKPARKESDIRFASVKPLQNTTLIAYLEHNRCIPLEIAQQYVQEVYFRLEGKTRWYFSLAFGNDSGGVEMRNADDTRKYKRCYGKKDITTLLPAHGEHPATVLVFEGFTDMLTYLVYYGLKAVPAPVIVLNSTALKDKALAAIRERGFTEVRLYLDHDDTGRRLTGDFQAELADRRVVDMAEVYQGFRDFNEFLQDHRRRPVPPPANTNGVLV